MSTARSQRPRVTRVAIVLGVLVLSLLAPSSAAAVRSEFFGIVQTATLDDQDLQGMEAAKVRTDRFLLNWGWVQPTQSSYKWDTADRFIGALASHGIRVVPSLWGNPSWLPGSSSTPPIGGSASENAWRSFLRAVVGRYGPGGAYWGTPYHQRYGASAKPLPITSWQVWNEPNLQKFFAPSPSPGKYAHLLQISHDAIKSKNPGAQIVLAGMPAHGDMNAWDFLKGLYSVPGIKNKFDAAALHPYAATIDEMQRDIGKFRAVMSGHGDAATPLWITEIAWGSAPRDGGINKGPAGQADFLTRAYNGILAHRTAWNVQRLFWYHWRDPQSSSASCSFCASAGLLSYDRSAKPAYGAFTSFTADTTRPVATITGGPSGFTTDPTPTFSFTSNEAGSTFICRVDAKPFKSCSSPYTSPRLSDGAHTFYVKAVDAAGNVSAVASRSFTIDTRPPAIPQITDTDPDSPANDNAPEVKGSAAAGTTVKVFKTAGCTGTPAAKGSAAKFHSPGLTVSVPDNSTTSFRARATDAAGNTSGCSAAFGYVEDSTP